MYVCHMCGLVHSHVIPCDKVNPPPPPPPKDAHGTS